MDGVSGHSLSVKLLMAPQKSFQFNESSVVFSVQDANRAALSDSRH